MAENSYLVAGLGNIGPEYASTRHNMGFMTLDTWAQESNVVFSTVRYGDIAKIIIKGRTFHLLKPSTYMNLSGNAVRYWLEKLSLGPESLIVICDDLNLPFGSVRMRKQGSDGGHNGLKNINELLGTTTYTRIRLGIGNDFNRGDQVDYVLGELSEEEGKQAQEMFKKSIEGIKNWAFIGPDRAMNSFNVKKTEKNI